MEDFSELYNQFKDEFEDTNDTSSLVDFIVKTNIQYKETRSNYNIALATPMRNVKSLRLVHLDISNIQVGVEDYQLYIHFTDPHTNETYNIQIDIPNGQNMSENTLIQYIKEQIIRLTPPSFKIQLTYEPSTHFIKFDAFKNDKAYQIDVLSSTTWNAFGYPNYNNGITSQIFIDSYKYIGERTSSLPNYHVIYHPSAPISPYHPSVSTFATSGYYISIQTNDKFQSDLLFYNTSITTTPTKLLFGTTASGLSLYNIGYAVQVGQTIYSGMNNYEPSASMGITTYTLLSDHLFMRTLNNIWVVGSTSATGSTMYALGLTHANIFTSPLTWSTTLRLAGGITTFTQMDISPYTASTQMFFMAYANSNSITGSGVASYSTTVLTPFKNFTGGIQHVKFGGTQCLVVDGNTFSMLYSQNGVTIMAHPFYTTSILMSVPSPNGQYVSIADKYGIDIYSQFRSNGYIKVYQANDIPNDMEWYGDRLYTTNCGGKIKMIDMTPSLNNNQVLDIYHPSSLSITCSSSLAQRLYFGTTTPTMAQNYSMSLITTNQLRYYIGQSYGTLLCFASAMNTSTIYGISVASSITSLDGDHTNINRQILTSGIYDIERMQPGAFTTASIIHSRNVRNPFFSSIGVSQLNIILTPPHLIGLGDIVGVIPDANILGITMGITTSVIFAGVTYIGIQVPELTVTSSYNVGATIQWYLPTSNLLFINQPMTDIPPYFNGITETWLDGFSIGGGSTVNILSYALSATNVRQIDIPELVMKLDQSDNTVVNDISGYKIDNTLAIIYGTSSYVHNPILYNNNLGVLNNFSIGFTTIDPTYELSDNLVHDVTLEILQVHTLPSHVLHNTRNDRIENPDSVYKRRIV